MIELLATSPACQPACVLGLRQLELSVLARSALVLAAFVAFLQRGTRRLELASMRYEQSVGTQRTAPAHEQCRRMNNAHCVVRGVAATARHHATRQTNAGNAMRAGPRKASALVGCSACPSQQLHCRLLLVRCRRLGERGVAARSRSSVREDNLCERAHTLQPAGASAQQRVVATLQLREARHKLEIWLSRVVHAVRVELSFCASKQLVADVGAQRFERLCIRDARQIRVLCVELQAAGARDRA